MVGELTTDILVSGVALPVLNTELGVGGGDWAFFFKGEDGRVLHSSIRSQ